jgi:hypothetical protein
MADTFTVIETSEEFYAEFLGDRGSLAGKWFRTGRSARPFTTQDEATTWLNETPHAQPWLRRRIIRVRAIADVVGEH